MEPAEVPARFTHSFTPASRSAAPTAPANAIPFTPPPSKTASARCCSSAGTASAPPARRDGAADPPLGLFDLLDHPEVLREAAARDVGGRHPEVAVVGPVGTPRVPALEVQLPADRLVADRYHRMAAEYGLVRLRHRHDPVRPDVLLERLVDGEPERDRVPGGEHVLDSHLRLRHARVADRLVLERVLVRLGGRPGRELVDLVRPVGLGRRAELRDRLDPVPDLRAGV